jgi:hypothetical protein
MCDVFGKVVDVKAQLARMFRQKLAELEVYCNQAAKTPVKERQVQPCASGAKSGAIFRRIRRTKAVEPLSAEAVARREAPRASHSVLCWLFRCTN